jgi:hypothetical protein
VPLSSTLAVPFVGGVVIVIVPVLGPSPPNVSFTNTGIDTFVSSSFTVALSASANGTSFTGATVMFTIAVSQSPFASHIS